MSGCCPLIASLARSERNGTGNPPPRETGKLFCARSLDADEGPLLRVSQCRVRPGRTKLKTESEWCVKGRTQRVCLILNLTVRR